MQQFFEAGTPWFVVDAAVTGRSHLADGTVCQDRTYKLTENGVTAFALADGAGSVKLSHYGAEVVTESICRLLCSSFAEFYSETSAMEVKTKILTHLREQLVRSAAEHGCSLRDLSSTLLAVAVCGDRYFLMHIGDGVIGYVKNGNIRVASVPDNGEFANLTTFVTSGNALPTMRVGKGCDPTLEGFVLMSDGCEAGLYSRGRKTLAPVLQRLIYRLGVTSERFLRPSLEYSLREVISRKTGDDCSLVLAARADRTYRDLSEDELDDYFSLDSARMKARHRNLRRTRYMQILDLLDQERTARELAKQCGVERSYFKHGWLKPLQDMGYVVRQKNNTYIRTVGLPLPGGNTNEKEEVSHELS